MSGEELLSSATFPSRFCWVNETFIHGMYTQIGCPILLLFLYLGHTHLLVRNGLVNKVEFLGETLIVDYVHSIPLQQ